MKLILAQGNPGRQYAHTRHNIGFLVADGLARQQGINFGPKPKFYAHIAEYSARGEKILLVKPDTFYNETGRSVRALVDFYKLDPATDLLVICDDLALPFGTIRTRQQGSDGGNNGLKSVTAHVNDRYHRIRIGIYNSLRDQINDADFVLSKFSSSEQQTLPQIIEYASQLATDFTGGQLQPTKFTVSTAPRTTLQ